MKKLPIGIQTFRKIIEKDYLYIDKTKEIYELLTYSPCLKAGDSKLKQH